VAPAASSPPSAAPGRLLDGEGQRRWRGLGFWPARARTHGVARASCYGCGVAAP
jgi:hypothetical protein